MSQHLCLQEIPDKPGTCLVPLVQLLMGVLFARCSPSRINAACWLLVGTLCLSPILAYTQSLAVATTSGEEAEGSSSFDGGLTRDTLERAAQTSRVLVTPPAASSAVRRHARAERPRRPGRPALATGWSDTPRRNLLVSFVYSWNGWVIHTFHTTKGTVMLRRIGFKG